MDETLAVIAVMVISIGTFSARPFVFPFVLDKGRESPQVLMFE